VAHLLPNVQTIKMQDGSLNPSHLDSDTKYIIETTSTGTVFVQGTPIQLPKIAPMQSNIWNWVPCPYQNSVPLTKLSFAFQNGDVLKSQFEFSEYYNGAWIGTLTQLQPGQGYQFKPSQNGDLTFLP